MTATTKDGPVLFEYEISTSASVFDKRPPSYIDTALLAPTGKPQSAPRIIEAEAAEGSPKSLETGRNRPIKSQARLVTIIREMTIYGNRDGMTQRAHTFSESLAYSVALSEKTVRRTAEIISIMTASSLFVFLKLYLRGNNIFV